MVNNQANTSSDTVEKKAGGREMVGVVVSSGKMQKTIVVVVKRRVKHRKYGKIMQRQTRLHAHDEAGVAQAGQVVRVREVRPLSKTKCWEFVEVVS